MSILRGNTPKIFLGGAQPLSTRYPTGKGKGTPLTRPYPSLDHLSPSPPSPLPDHIQRVRREVIAKLHDPRPTLLP